MTRPRPNLPRLSRLIVLAVAVFAVTLPLVQPAAAVTPSEMLSDPALEARARALSKDLRCLVCQNQSIDDSDAPLARDLRVLVRERLTAGDSDKEIVEYVVARYGEFVLLTPPFGAKTLLLWLTPLLVLGGGIYLVRRTLAAASAQDSEKPSLALTSDEEGRVAELINRDS